LCCSIFTFLVVYCRNFFVFLSFFWPLYCLSFIVRFLITHLVSSNFYLKVGFQYKKKTSNKVFIFLYCKINIQFLFCVNNNRQPILKCVFTCMTIILQHILVIFALHEMKLVFTSKYKESTYFISWVTDNVYTWKNNKDYHIIKN
jgi:hypothetical protein